MNRLLVMVLALAIGGAAPTPAFAGDTAPKKKPAKWKRPKRPKSMPLAKKLVVGEWTPARVELMWVRRDTLRRYELTALAHAERTRKQGFERAQLIIRALTHVVQMRNDVAAALHRYVTRARPKNSRNEAEADVLALLGELYLDQWNTLDAYDEAVEVLDVLVKDTHGEPRFVGARKNIEDLRSTFPNGTQATEKVWRLLVKRHPHYTDLGPILFKLATAQFDKGQSADAKHSLQLLLCANHQKELEAADKVRKKAGDDLQARVYAASAGLTEYQTCRPLIRDESMVDSAWLRLGRLHRDQPGEQQLAISAYERIIGNPDSEEYLTALEELSATHVANEQLLEAVPHLDALVEYVDRIHEDEGVTDETYAVLRVKAVERVGRILAQLWRASAVPKSDASLELAKIYFRGRNHQPHVREVYDELGGALRVYGAFNQAIPVWQHILVAWPDHPDAPTTQDKIVRLLVEKGDVPGADAERRHLLTMFGATSAWSRANRSDKKAIAMAQQLAADTLYTLASNRFRLASAHHHSAGGNSYAGMEATPIYDDAIALNAQYVVEYPRSKRVYDAAFRHAEVLRYSRNFREAARRFRWVRERGGQSGPYFDEATRLMLNAHHSAVEQAIRQNKLVRPKHPTKSELKTGKRIEKLPALWAELQAAYGSVADVQPTPSASAWALLDAGMIDLRHHRLPEAKKRFERIIEEYCQTPAANSAARWIKTIDEVQGRDGLAQQAKNLINRACGDSARIKVARDQRIRKDFAAADTLLLAGRYLDAGRRFYSAYRETSPKHPLHDDSVFFAADAFAKAGKHRAAVALFSWFQNRRTLKTSEFAGEAMWRLAEVRAEILDYARAAQLYVRVAALRGTKTPSRAKFDLESKAIQALERAAKLRQLDRYFYDQGTVPGAATLYKRFAQAQTDNEQLSDAFLAAGLVYKQAGDVKKLVATFAEWKRRVGKWKGAPIFELRFNFHLAAAYLVAGDLRGVERSYTAAVVAFNRGKMKPGTSEARLAAEAQFWLADQLYARLIKPFVFRWPEKENDKANKAQMKKLDAAIRDTSAALDKVMKFDTEWTIAARARMGDLLLEIVNKVIDAPPPKSAAVRKKLLGKTHGIEGFAEAVRKQIQPFFLQSEREWNSAVIQAKQRSIDNKWSRWALQQLNSHISNKKYPALRDEIIVSEDSP